MRKSDLHPDLRARCVPVPGRSGCHAVVPPPVPFTVSVPECHGLMVLARRELEGLADTIAQAGPRAELLLRMLNRREAVDSSQIEGTRTGFDGLLIHEIDADAGKPAADPDAGATLGYLRAFAAGCREIDARGRQALDLDLVRRLHGQLMAGQDRADPGSWRDNQNFIGLRLETARYVPPPPGEVPRLMEDLLGLLQYAPEDVAVVPLLLRAAIVHAQFEAIHPFRDGNGRTGRLLLPLMFRAEGAPPIHLATFLKLRQQAYYDALWQVQTRLRWAPWIGLFLESVVASCRHTARLLGRLEALGGEWNALLAARGRRRHAAAWRLAGLLLGQPVVTVPAVAAALGISFPAANDAVADLAALDILRPAGDRRRNRAFHAHQVMNALYTGLDEVLDDVARLTES